MTPFRLYAELRARGVALAADGDCLVTEGVLTDDDRARIRALKPALLAIVADPASEVAWRVAAMRPHATPAGPVPLLVARPGQPRPGRCVSCGDALDGGRRYRCGPCARAAEAVLNEAREGVTAQSDARRTA